MYEFLSAMRNIPINLMKTIMSREAPHYAIQSSNFVSLAANYSLENVVLKLMQLIRITNVLNIIYRPILIKNDVSETSICLRHWVKSTLLGPIQLLPVAETSF